MTTMTTMATTKPTTVLLLTQNLGSIECHGTAHVTPQNKTLTRAWTRSVAAFVERERVRIARRRRRKRQRQRQRRRQGAQEETSTGDTEDQEDDTDNDDDPTTMIVVIHLQEIGGKKYNAAFNDYLRSVIHTCCPNHLHGNNKDGIGNDEKDGNDKDKDDGHDSNEWWCSGLLGPQQDDATTFTALGTVILVHGRRSSCSNTNNTVGAQQQQPQQSANDVSLWSFAQKEFVPLSQYPQKDDFWSGAKFSTAGTSRKGYLLTRLKITGTNTIDSNDTGKGNNSNNDNTTTILQFLNLHVVHDADNRIAAAQPFPSDYAQTRARALVEALPPTVAPGTASQDDPLFLFGDLNLRLDAHQLQRMLQDKFHETIALEQKKIHASDQVWDFLAAPANWPFLRTSLDRDAAFVRTKVREATGIPLSELPIRFGPTYLLDDDDNDDDDEEAVEFPRPSTCNGTTMANNNNNIKKRKLHHDDNKNNDSNDDGDDDDEHDDQEEEAEDVALGAHYKKHTRFPAWCDRVWFNPAGRALMVQKNQEGEDENDTATTSKRTKREDDTTTTTRTQQDADDDDDTTKKRDNGAAAAATATTTKQAARYWTAPLHPMDHLAVYLRFQIH